MIGIIYKFTIIAKYKYDGHKPFYVGQHVGENDFDDYWGSGTIWNNFLDKLKQDYPNCWMRLIRSETLYIHECSQKALDKLEEYYIKKCKAHYSYKQGGCNVLWGTANKFGSGSPMKDPMIAKKCAEKFRKHLREHPETMERIQSKRIWKLHNTDYKQKISRTLKGRYVGENNPNYGNYWTDEQKKRQSDKMIGRYVGENNPNFGRKWSDEKRKNMSEMLRKTGVQRGENNAMYGKKRITNGVINTVIKEGEPLPDGFWYGMKPRNKKTYED